MRLSNRCVDEARDHCRSRRVIGIVCPSLRTEQAITLSLNDVVIYERSVDWVGDHRFGLYRHGTTAEVKVRKVELTGDWPETLPQQFLDNPAATAGEPMTVNQSHCLNRIFQEDYLAENVFAVHRKASTMPVADRFEFLSRWVLPGPIHPGFRMTGDFTQTQPAPVAYEPGVEHPDFGGQIVSPVFDWLEAARELGRLPECLTSVEGAVTPDTEPQRRARIGLSLLLNLELGNQQAASERCEALYELLQATTAEEQWAEMLVIDYSSRKFTTNDVGRKVSGRHSHAETTTIATFAKQSLAGPDWFIARSFANYDERSGESPRTDVRLQGLDSRDSSDIGNERPGASRRPLASQRSSGPQASRP